MTTIKLDDMLTCCQTGDILLFNTRGAWYDALIEKVTGSKFSHVGIIVRDMSFSFTSSCDEHNVKLCMLESGSEEFPDSLDGKDIFGVRLSDLSKVMNEYSPSMRNGYVYYRKMNYNRDEHFNSYMKKAIESVYGRPYDLLPQDWIRSGLGIKSGNERRTNTFWCSALAAYIYWKLGLVDENIEWTIIQPTSFSYYEGKELTWYSGMKLEPEKCVVL